MTPALIRLRMHVVIPNPANPSGPGSAIFVCSAMANPPSFPMSRVVRQRHSGTIVEVQVVDITPLASVLILVLRFQRFYNAWIGQRRRVANDPPFADVAQ